MTSSASDDVAARMRAEVAKDQGGWDRLWQAGTTPWDRGESQVSLRDFLQDGKVSLPTSGKVLVPGCGAGYDCLTLARFGGGSRSVLGLEIAQTAIDKAGELLKNTDEKTRSLVTFEKLDFFTARIPEAPFDVIYDHTFFCAIPLSMRTRWAERMTELCRPGGQLILQMFPLKKATAADEGPPFLVTPEAYHELLSDHFEKVLLEVPRTSSEERKGREMIGLYRRR